MTGLQDPIAQLLGEWSAGSGIGAVLLRFFLALIMGAIIGCERSSKRHSAGFRTFILVMLSGIGAMLLDSYVLVRTGNSFFFISAAFLVAVANISIHSIFYTSKNEIRGLTTAVALFAAGMIGLMTGGGFYTTAVIFFVVLMCTLSWFPAFEAYLKNRSNHFEIHLELNESIYLQDFVTTIRKLGLRIDEIELNRAYLGSGLSVYSISVSISSEELKKYKTHTQIIEALDTLEYVYYIEEMHV